MVVLIILACVWFNNLVLDKNFYTLGLDWASAPFGNNTINNLDNPDGAMNKAEVLYKSFPRRASCKVRYYGTGGSWVPDTHNYFCILAPNVISQYIFLILWFWYGFLLLINTLNFLRTLLMVLRFATVRNLYLMGVIGSRKVIYYY